MLKTVRSPRKIFQEHSIRGLSLSEMSGTRTARDSCHINGVS